MTLFRSLYTRYEKESDLQSEQIPPWPAVYRRAIPDINLNNFSFQVRIENQLPKVMTVKQLLLLPTFNEAKNIYSKAGWMYQGRWSGLTFQTLFNLFSTPNLYPWVRLESLDNQIAVIERQALMNYRLVADCDGQPLSPLYGGPLWVQHFEQYVEYGFSHLKSVTLLQGEHEYQHPHQALGFPREDAEVSAGEYYAIHKEQIIAVERPISPK